MSQLTVSVSPHLRDRTTTSRIMLDVILALVPALVAAVWIFGARAALVVLVCVASCVLSEWLYEKAMKKPSTIGDLSAVVTGLLLAYNLPVAIPIWMAVVGSAFAVIFVKQLFGGIGKNFANPAITARIFMFIAFSTMMATWFDPADIQKLSLGIRTPSRRPRPWRSSRRASLAPCRPFRECCSGCARGCLAKRASLRSRSAVFIHRAGVISWHTPVTFIATVFALTALMGQQPVYQLCPAACLGAFFMATDYATTPQTSWGRVVFGSRGGHLTALITSTAATRWAYRFRYC
jgi:electron transport complex protein RnfD